MWGHALIQEEGIGQKLRSLRTECIVIEHHNKGYKNMSEQLTFTFAELQTISIHDVDVYVAAGVSLELDCCVMGGPPAGSVHPNSLGIDILSVDALKRINLLLMEGKREEAIQWIEQSKARAKKYSQVLFSNAHKRTMCVTSSLWRLIIFVVFCWETQRTVFS